MMGEEHSSPDAPSGKSAGAGWVAAARALQQVLQFALVIVAAQYLDPATFGVFTLASVFLQGLLVVAQAGWRERVVYVTASDHGELRRVATCALGSGLLLATVGMGVARAGVILGLSQSSASVLAGLVLCLPFSPLNTFQAGLMLARGQLRELAALQVGSELAGFVVAWMLLHAGQNIYALVAGRIAVNVVALCAGVWVTRWLRFAAPFPLREFRTTLAFSRGILLARVTWFAQNNAAIFLVGLLLGARGTGLYRAGARFAGAANELINEPTRMHAWALLKPVEGDESAGVQGHVVARILGQQLSLSLPIYMGLSVTAPQVVEAFLGEGWSATAPVLALLALANLAHGPESLTEPALVMRGRVGLVPRLTALGAMLSLGALALFAPLGLTWAAVGQLLVAMVWLAITIAVQSKVAHVPWRMVVMELAPLAGVAALMAGAVLLVTQALQQNLGAWQLLAVQVPTGAAVYLTALRALAPERLADLERLVLRRRSAS